MGCQRFSMQNGGGVPVLFDTKNFHSKTCDLQMEGVGMAWLLTGLFPFPRPT